MPQQMVRTKVVGAPRWQIGSTDWAAVAKAFGLALAVFAVQYSQGIFPHLDFGSLTPYVAVVVPPLLVALLKLLTNTQQTVIDTDPLNK